MLHSLLYTIVIALFFMFYFIFCLSLFLLGGGMVFLPFFIGLLFSLYIIIKILLLLSLFIISCGIILLYSLLFFSFLICINIHVFFFFFVPLVFLSFCHFLFYVKCILWRGNCDLWLYMWVHKYPSAFLKLHPSLCRRIKCGCLCFAYFTQYIQDQFDDFFSCLPPSHSGSSEE